MTGTSIRVVIADDHPVVRGGLSALLDSVPSITMAGMAASGREAVHAAVTLHPDVLVMDIQMPELSGVAATQEITRAAPEVAVLMLTMFDDHDSVLAAMRAGARVHAQGRTAGRDRARDRGRRCGRGHLRARHRTTGARPGLHAASPRSSVPRPDQPGKRGAQPHRRGVRNAEIARQMSIAPKTVANHVSAIFTKLQVTGRSEAIILARDAGLGRNDLAT
jgi:DNA-binding NarL/FixJ family response regulator